MQTKRDLQQYARAYPLYPFLYNDAGRSTSKRPKAKNDCTVRAFSLVAKIPYDQSYDLLAAYGRKCGKGFDLKKVPGVIWNGMPAIKGEKRVQVRDLHKRFPTETIIARKAKHVFAVINGIIHDDCENRLDARVYGYFTINRDVITRILE